VAIDSGVGAGQNLAAIIARMAALGLGGALVLRSEIGLGTLVAFLGYLGGVFSPVQSLSSVYRTLRVAAVSADQVFAILDAEDAVRDAPGACDIAPVRGEVEFKDVRFSYRRGGAPLLDGISLHVRAGESVALVGPSGAGKSTLMALLQRFYDPDSGRVIVDGVDVRDVKQTSLRRHVGVVLQDALLFNDSVRANIAYGVPRASMAQIEAAARAARAHDFIVRLPQGYETLVGERGSRLSAGERQRLAIARSLLKDSAIVILDEPTSALDIESESLIQRALAELLRGRTTFVIAHRLSTVVHMDRILVLNHGRIVEQGNHATLMALGGYYASLVRRQASSLGEGAPSAPVADCA
jgi:ATP-binding cassette subfamily B protein